MIYQERLFRQSVGYGCEPTTIALIAVAAIGTGLTLAQQHQNQKAQSKYQSELVEANNKVEHLKQSELRQQEAQINESDAREKHRATLASQDSKAATIAALGNSSITGNTVTQLLAEHDMQLGQYKEALDRQNTLDRGQIDTAVQTGALGTVMSNRSINAPVSGPNYAAGAVNFAGQALGAYNSYKGQNRTSGSPISNSKK
jgi:hypothetical protein